MRQKQQKRSQKDREWDKERQREVVRHIKMDQAPSEVKKQRVIERMEREEVWKSSHDEMDSTGP